MTNLAGKLVHGAVCLVAAANRAWLFRAKGLPADDAKLLEQRLKEMAGF